MATPAQLLPHVDELVMEYLLFRGFTKSFQALAAERKRDRTKAFDVEQIITQLLTFVQTYQIEPLLDTWKFLEARFFSRLDASYIPTIRELKDSWLRLYVVNAIKTGQRDKAIDGPISSSSSDSWHRWFILPYMQTPESDPHFRSFFTKQWLESFVTSFRNFLSLIFRNLPLPKLLAFQISRLEEPSAKLRLKTSQSECNRLRSSNAQATERIHKLEDAGHQLYRIVQTMVQHTFAEHFSWTDASRSLSGGPALGEGSAVSSASMKTMATLSDQLRDLHEIFGPSTVASSTSQVDKELEAVLLTPPLQVKLNPVDTTTPLADKDTTSSATKLSSPNSSSRIQLAKPTVKTNPELVETTVFSDAMLDGDTKATCAYAHDGKRLRVSQMGSHEISIFDVDAEGGATLRNAIHTESNVVGVDWMADSQCVIFALQDGTINVWDTETKARTFTMSYNSDERRPTHLACAQSKAIGAVALVGGSSAVEDAPLSSCIQFFTLKDHAMRVLSSVELDDGLDIVALRWASDGSVLAVCSSDGRVAFVSPSTQRPPRTCRLPGDANQVESLALTPHGQSLLLCQPQSSESEGNEAHIVGEWSLKGVMAATTTPPLMQYLLPKEMEMAPGDGTTTTTPHLDIKALGSMFAVSRSSAEDSSFVLLTRGQSDPATSVVRVPCQIIAMTWHPHARFLTAVTRTGKLLTWKVTE